MKCPKCGETPNKNLLLTTTAISILCPSCDKFSSTYKWNEEKYKEDKFRPKHYEKGHDTFAWAEHKFDLETNIAICQFNIHKYNDRKKGQTIEDFENIIAYAKRALDLIKEDKMEVT